MRGRVLSLGQGRNWVQPNSGARVWTGPGNVSLGEGRNLSMGQDGDGSEA